MNSRKGSYRFKSIFVLVLCLLTTHIASAQPRSANKPISFRSITIVTEPNAIVWVDGVRYGETDETGKMTIATIAPGIRSLRVRANGFAEVTKSIPATTRGEIPIKLAKTTDAAELAYQSAEILTSVDRQKAIAEYERAIKLRPKYPEAFVGLARMYSLTGDVEKAYKAIGSAKRLRPGYAEASAVEGRILKDSDEEAKAIAAFKRAITEGRGYQPEAYTGLGMLYKDRAEFFGGSGDYEQETANYNESTKYLAIAVKQLGGAPDAITVYQLLGLIYERQKKLKEAIALYEEFLQIFPNVVEAEAVRSFIVQIKKEMAEPK